MDWSFVAFVSLSLLANSEWNRESVVDPPGDITFHCLILEFPPSLCEALGFDNPEQPAVLSDIESFFLLKLPGGIRSKPLRIPNGETIKLTHTSEHYPTEKWLSASGTIIDEKLHQRLIATKDSPLQLPKDIMVELPERHSALIPTLTFPSPNRRYHIWVLRSAGN